MNPSKTSAVQRYFRWNQRWNSAVQRWCLALKVSFSTLFRAASELSRDFQVMNSAEWELKHFRIRADQRWLSRRHKTGLIGFPIATFERQFNSERSLHKIELHRLRFHIIEELLYYDACFRHWIKICYYMPEWFRARFKDIHFCGSALILGLLKPLSHQNSHVFQFAGINQWTLLLPTNRTRANSSFESLQLEFCNVTCVRSTFCCFAIHHRNNVLSHQFCEAVHHH